jgi:hypothetical protein
VTISSYNIQYPVILLKPSVIISIDAKSMLYCNIYIYIYTYISIFQVQWIGFVTGAITSNIVFYFSNDLLPLITNLKKIHVLRKR